MVILTTRGVLGCPQVAGVAIVCRTTRSQVIFLVVQQTIALPIQVRNFFICSEHSYDFRNKQTRNFRKITNLFLVFLCSEQFNLVPNIFNVFRTFLNVPNFFKCSEQLKKIGIFLICSEQFTVYFCSEQMVFVPNFSLLPFCFLLPPLPLTVPFRSCYFSV